MKQSHVKSNNAQMCKNLSVIGGKNITLAKFNQILIPTPIYKKKKEKR